MNIGEKIKVARLAKGYTQEELGDLLGVQKSAVAKYENGRVVNIKRSVLAKISKVLEIPPVELVSDINEKPLEIVNKIDIDTISQLNDTNISKLNTYANNLLQLQQMENEPILMAAHNDYTNEPDEQKKMLADIEKLGNIAKRKE